MTTFLQLCKDVSRECNVSGGDTVPTTVASQSGELQKIVTAVRDEWTDLQNRPVGWRWMRSEFTVTTVSGTGSYAYTSCTDTITSALISRFGRWLFNNKEDPATSYLTSVANEYRLVWMPWLSFKNIYRIGTQNNGQPAHISIDPQNNIVLGPVPNAAYVVTGPYQRGAQILAVDADEPDMPSRFHGLIMYLAMERYGFSDAAQEVVARAQQKKRQLMRQLEDDQGEEIGFAGPIV